MNKRLIFFISMISSSLFAMDSVQVIPSSKASKKTAYLDWLMARALEEKDLKIICHLIPKYFNESDVKAPKKGYELCHAALSLNHRQAVVAFEEAGIDKMCKKMPMKGKIALLICLA